MTKTGHVGWLVVWMAAGALVGAALALWQEVPQRVIPFWAVMGVLVVLVGKLVQMISESEQREARQPVAVEKKVSDNADRVRTEVTGLGVTLPDRRLSEEEARAWLDDLLVKQQSESRE